MRPHWVGLKNVFIFVILSRKRVEVVDLELMSAFLNTDEMVKSR